MFENLNIDKLKTKYKSYGNYYINLSNDKFGISNVSNDIKLKINHGISMSDGVGLSTLNSGLLNETYEVSGYIDGLFHDIGRFKQYYECGTLNDYESSKIIGFDDHGRYGSYLLNEGLIQDFIPNERLYDYVLSEIVKEHTNIKNKDYIISIDKLKNVFQNYTLDEILKSNNQDIKNKLIALKLLLVIEQDSLELLQKVRDGLFKPAIGFEKKYYVHEDIWYDFINFKYIDMNKFKNLGIWTCNAGFLLRFSLIFRNINLVGTLKSILEDNTIDKVFEMQSNNVTDDNNKYILDKSIHDPRLKDAYEYTKIVIDNLIKTSDGIIITDNSRLEALELSKKTLK